MKRLLPLAPMPTPLPNLTGNGVACHAGSRTC